MDKLFLNKGLVTGTALTQDGVLAYMALRIIIDESIPLYNKMSSVDCVSMNRMAYALVGSQEKYEKVLLDSLQRGIYELKLANVLNILQDFSTKTSYEYLLDMANMRLDTEKDNFMFVYPEEVHKILTCDEIMKKKISMLRYFVALISTFNWCKSMRNLQGKISTMSIEYIATQAGIMSQRTCIRYNEILSEMKMIYVYKSNDKERVGDKLKQIKNCYSRYADKDACEEYASNYENWYGSQHIIVRTQKNKEQADNNRRLAQIYNRISDGYGDTYDEETIRKVQKYIANKNRTLRQEIDAKYAQEYMTDSDRRWVAKLESQIKDESVFEQFDFLKDDDNWGKPVSMEHDFSIEEILDMDGECEVQSESVIANTDCFGHNDLCKVVSRNNFVTPKIEPDDIKSNNFTSNVRISEPKVSADKVQNPNNSDIADNESHSGKIPSELFCVTGKDSGLIDLDDLY